MSVTYFITGIGTNVGKTIASAILTEALEADYWKPLQAGDLGNSEGRECERINYCGHHLVQCGSRMPGGS